MILLRVMPPQNSMQGFRGMAMMVKIMRFDYRVDRRVYRSFEVYPKRI